ncbi:MAG: DUF885 family protein [Gemmatimonadota bacterium]|jgi:hypothetical protein
MPETRPEVGAWLDRFFDSCHRHRPVDATFIGVHDHDHLLPDFSESGVGEALADVLDLLASSDALPGADGPGAVGPAGDAEALDLRLARGFLRIGRWELTGGHFHRGNPSLYTGEAAFGFLSLFLGHGGSVAHRVEAAGRRLEGVASLLGAARDNVRRAPGWWTERAIRECRGVLELLGDGVDALSTELSVDPAVLRGPADGARRAVADHLAWLESELLSRPTRAVAAGEEALELYLREGHFLSDSIDDLVSYAEDGMAEAEGWLRAHAGDFGADSAADVLARLADSHPTLDGYLRRYREIWDEVRGLSEREGLITWREFPIRYVPRPMWVRKAAPYLYFLYYRSPAAYRRPPVHDYLVTPIDRSVPADRRRALLRAHSDSVIKLNHVVHHGGIGHHMQNWNAFRAASRVGRVAAVDCASRIAMTCGGTMAEGWACYATDLIAEFGGLTPLEAYAERSSRVRMCARAVVDLQLHRGRMGMDEAAAFYVERAGMSEAAARSETVKNSMFPGGAVMYLAGTDAIHRLRREMEALRGNDFDLRDFHDTFLSYGSVPVTLVAEAMKRREAGGPEPAGGRPEAHAR